MQSPLPLLPPRDRGALTWKIWAAVQKTTGRRGQSVAGSGMSSPWVLENRLVMIWVARQYSPKYTRQNRKAIRAARLHFGIFGWDWIDSI
jgi:hypothetical protein